MYEGYVTIVILVIQDLNGKTAKNIAVTQSEDYFLDIRFSSILFAIVRDSYSFDDKIIHLRRLHVAIAGGPTHFN